MKGLKMKRTDSIKRILTAAALGGVGLCASSRADMVTDWNANLQHAIASGLGSTPPLEGRPAAIVQAAVYDAVNGIEQKYEPYFVTDPAPPGARPEAAAAEAAYTALVALFPSQKTNFDTELAASLASIPGYAPGNPSIVRGLAWGEYVANAILAWRRQDGSSTVLPPYFGGTAPGIWRSIPDGTLPAAFRQLTILTPFAMTSQSQFRPGPPPALNSQQYADDVNEVKAIGRVDSTERTPEQTQIAKLWATVAGAEDQAVARAVLPPDADLVDNARILALANIALADCLIASFDCKYTYNFWRPYHAIRLADADGNPLTVPDTNWTSLITAPRFQEYPSNHAVITTGFMRALADLVGDEQTFVLSSPGYPSYTIIYNRLSDAATEVGLSRIWGGIHFRNSVNVGHDMGTAIADYVVSNFLRPLDEAE
jgi:hypothetical protein